MSGEEIKYAIIVALILIGTVIFLWGSDPMEKFIQTAWPFAVIGGIFAFCWFF